MSLRRTCGLTLTIAIAASVAAVPVVPAAAVPLTQQTTADRAVLESTIERYEAAQARSADADARVREASAELDRVVAEERLCQERLRSHAASIYRAGEASTLSLLLGATTIQDLTTRFDLLTRIGRQTAENIEALKAARIEAEKSAGQLLELQAEQARALDALAEEVADAKKRLAASEAALREYEARMAAAAQAAAAKAAAARAATAPTQNDPDQSLSGSGEWQTAVASHYGRNFTGRGANGESIGPYSMIVAHKTLPFGTLIEFEYAGKRAVARVADRGPHTAGREFDLGPGVVRVLDFSGVREVRYRIIAR